MYGFASGVSTAMLSGIFGAISIMVCMTVSALIYRSAMGGQKDGSGIRESECFGWEKYCFGKKWIIEIIIYHDFEILIAIVLFLITRNPKEQICICE